MPVALVIGRFGFRTALVGDQVLFAAGVFLIPIFPAPRRTRPLLSCRSAGDRKRPFIFGDIRQSTHHSPWATRNSHPATEPRAGIQSVKRTFTRRDRPPPHRLRPALPAQQLSHAVVAPYVAIIGGATAPRLTGYISGMSSIRTTAILVPSFCSAVIMLFTLASGQKKKGPSPAVSLQPEAGNRRSGLAVVDG